jgi:hypothetical protein
MFSSAGLGGELAAAHRFKRGNASEPAGKQKAGRKRAARAEWLLAVVSWF